MYIEANRIVQETKHRKYDHEYARRSLDRLIYDYSLQLNKNSEEQPYQTTHTAEGRIDTMALGSLMSLGDDELLWLESPMMELPKNRAST